MAVLARVHITSQERLDLPQLLGMESYTAYDFRALIEAFVGSTKPYIARGFEITGKTGLFVSVSLADCFVFNPLDTNGSFYLGDANAIDQQVEMPPSQPFVYLEARFSNITSAPVSASYWDPLSVSGNTEGAEFTATQNSQNMIQMELSVNTVGFSTDAIPITVCSTSNSDITTLSDARPLMFRLGTGGASPNPGYKFPWSSSRGEPLTTGAGTGNDLTSSFKSRDNTGILNDKGIRSFKEMFDAICSRICEISGSSIWYSSSGTQAYVGGLSLSGIYFDSIGHTLQPKTDFIYNWSGTALSNIGTASATWRANYTDIEWQLGNTFQNASYREYSDVQFNLPIPNGSNAYLVLEREVTKNAGNNIIWKSPTPATTYSDFVTNWESVVSGVTADFAGIAVGDYIRKESQGYSQYYKVIELANATASVSQTVGVVADNSVVALKLSKVIDTYSVEPLRYFRSRYSFSDLQVLSAITNAPTVDYYWIARRNGDFIYLRDFGPLWRSRSWEHLDKAWSKIKLLKEYQNTFLTGGGNISFESVPGNNLLEWTSPFYIEIAGRNATYTIPMGSTTITDGQCLYVDIPEDETNSSLTMVSCPIADVPINPLDIGYSDRIYVLWHRRGNSITGLNDAPDLDSGETDTIGWDLPLAIRTRLGIISETNYQAYSTTYVVDPGDSYPEAISKLDSAVYAIITDTAKEEIIVLGSNTTIVDANILTAGNTYTGKEVQPWMPAVDNVDIQVFVNDIPQTQDQTGGLLESFRKLDNHRLEFSYPLKAGWKIRIRDERTGGTGGGSGSGEINTASNRGSAGDGYGIYASKSGVDLQFYRIKAGLGITLSQESNDILISSTGGGGGGETNTASNVGSGTGIYASKVGVDLRFKSLVAGTNVTLSATSTEITINASGGSGSGEANTASNIGTGTGIFSVKSGVDLQFKSLKALTTSGLGITSDATSITYSLAATGANVGTGTGVFAQKNATTGNFEFKTIVAGTNVTLSNTATEITINATGGSGSGEVNTASNIGTGTGVFSAKVGVDLQFKSLKALTTSGLAITSDTNSITYSWAATGANLGAGTGVFAQKNVTTGNLEFKSIVAGTNVTLSNTSTAITINATGGGSGEINTASNLGTGTGVFASKVGVDLQFKSLKAGTNVTITSTSTDITITAASGGGGGTTETQSLTFDTGNIAIRASGSTADLALITATKDFSTANTCTLILNKPTTVVYHSIYVTFTAAETVGRAQVALQAPDTNAATTVDQAIRPFAIRYNLPTNGIGATASTFTLTSGSVFTTLITGFTAGQTAKASFTM
jgi:hypothetical protein